MGAAAGTHSTGYVRDGLGTRVRQLRVAAGLTQSQLAGERFSKEYVSQIERGKTRPTRETIEWLAARLGVDAGFLADGVSADERLRLEARLAQGEALSEGERWEDAAALYDELAPALAAAGSPELEVRAICGAWKALVPLGRVREALDRLTRARELSEDERFSDVERAGVLYRIGVCRHVLQSNATALALLDEALTLVERAGAPADQLIANILHWRSRCYRRQRDYEAAREDVERALELAQGVRDPKTMGHLYFQASLLAERQGHWVLARTYAERARHLYEEVADRTSLARLLNNLGGLNVLLGRSEDAVRFLKDAFATALEAGNDADAAQAISSLAQVHLRAGKLDVAEQQARHALRLLEGRVDYLHEIGNAQLVLGRSLLERGRLDEAEAAFRAAEASFEQFGSASHRASAWVARGDLAARRGDDRAAARLYRMAAEALQDVRF
ncbi:MAG: tetratricopeptide repeat protein [Thermoleophilia bacterium]|nr:tetratricopeptide repeat protein [Thermoleophilia bacterium]